MKRAIVKFKEVGRDHNGSTTYIGLNITREFIIDFYGLNEDDIEWFEIEIEDC